MVRQHCDIAFAHPQRGQSDHLETQPVEYRCYCSRDRVTRTLISLGRKELQSIVDDGKDIHIDCQFCDRIYDYTPEQVRQILKELDE